MFIAIFIAKLLSLLLLILLLLLLSLLGSISMGSHMVTSAFCPKSNNFPRPLGAGN